MEEDRQKEREPVPVPVRRKEKVIEEERREIDGDAEKEVREMPRRWYVY